ncbi:MAG: redox-sensing transcriptional repressor Rex [Clostridia bacterium]|nr:redox-sensing transcriptional repressor Rex [Clostridia bacterium]
MSKSRKISMSVVRRLPHYYRFLLELKNNGVYRVSSQALAEKMGSSASQIRQDLHCFGGFGQQGYGYDVPKLADELGSILGLDNHFKAILLGAGNLGRAIINHVDFSSRGFTLTAVFDCDPGVIGTQINGMTVRDVGALKDYCTAEKPDAAVLCLPKESAEEMADILYDCGVRGFWNFSHYDLSMKYGDAVTENVHLNDSLMTLCCCMNASKENNQIASKPGKPRRKLSKPKGEA